MNKRWQLVPSFQVLFNFLADGYSYTEHFDERTALTADTQLINHFSDVLASLGINLQLLRVVDIPQNIFVVDAISCMSKGARNYSLEQAGAGDITRW